MYNYLKKKLYLAIKFLLKHYFLVYKITIFIILILFTELVKNLTTITDFMQRTSDKITFDPFMGNIFLFYFKI